MWKNKVQVVYILPVVGGSEPGQVGELEEIWPNWQANF